MPVVRVAKPQEDIRDGTAHKSSLSPRALRVLAVVGIFGCWLIGFPFWVNVVFTASGLIVFMSAEQISKGG